MSAKDSTNITIPSVFVSEFTGSLLKEVYAYNENYFVLINDLPLNINTHLLLPFAIVVGICFLVMVIFMVRFFRSNIYQSSTVCRAFVFSLPIVFINSRMQVRRSLRSISNASIGGISAL